VSVILAFPGGEGKPRDSRKAREAVSSNSERFLSPGPPPSVIRNATPSGDSKNQNAPSRHFTVAHMCMGSDLLRLSRRTVLNRTLIT
jgi:hypothetical protein